MFTIKQKLTSIGIISVLSLLILAGMSMYAQRQVETASNENLLRQGQINTVNVMRQATLQVLLAAGDSLVDKDIGTILPKRRRIMETNIATLHERVQNLLDKAGTDQERQIAEALSQKINGLEKGVLQQLPHLLQTHATQNAYDNFDNVLNANGRGLDKDLGEYATSVEKQVKAATQRMENALSLSKTLMWVATAAATVILGILLIAIERSIISALSSMTNAMLTLAHGDKTIAVPGVGRSDEIGQMADAVQVFKENMIKADQLAEEQRLEHEAVTSVPCRSKT